MSARLPDPGAAFSEAVASLRGVRLPASVSIQEVPAPTRVAPFSLALGAEVSDRGQELATGKFVLLHDPAGQESWDGTMRIVTFVRADLEPELGEDPMLAEIGWTWLVEQLEGLPYTALGGTVTRVLSRGFGALGGRPSTVEVEVRASWSPIGTDTGPHLHAWAGMLCTVAGLPPLPDGVCALQRGVL